MAILPIIIAPDPRLKQVCAPVARVDDEIRALIDDLLETMLQAPGVGLAAPQVGVFKRILVVDVAGEEMPPQPQRLINPELLWASDEKVAYEEGCLSLPDFYADIERPGAIRIRHLDDHGKVQELRAEGLLATCIQHEMDHLEGVLFVDHLSALRRNMILRKLRKAKKADGAPVAAAAP